jgi:hypothetical protein
VDKYEVNIYLILLEQQFTGGSSIEKYVVVSSESV